MDNKISEAKVILPIWLENMGESILEVDILLEDFFWEA